MTGRERVDEPTQRRGRSRRAIALAAVLVVVSLMIVAGSGPFALAQTTDPTTTTTPPDPTTTTVPNTTTTTVPDTTTTTVPTGDTTTTVPTGDTTTTVPSGDTTTTTEPDVDLGFLNDIAAQIGKLDPGEALVPRPEFGTLSGHQRDLVQQLQTATDAFALRRFALVDLTKQLTAAKDALAAARAAENSAVLREILGLADAAHDEGVTAPADDTRDARVAAFRALKRRLEADRKKARAARVQAQDAFDTVNTRFEALNKVVGDAFAARTAAESAIENELGSDAVRARPDGITETLAVAQAGQEDSTGASDLELPIPGAPLSSPFGLRNDPLGGGAGFHPGVDFAASSGTPIHASGAGVVVTAGDCGGYGYCVVIDHGSRIATLYGHQSQVVVSVGEHVDAGEVIGYVGSTGMSTGPHLHFEVRSHGLPIDPVLALLPT